MQTSAKYITKSSQEKRGKMGKIKQQSINSRTEFFYYAFRNILLVSVPLLLIFALILSLPHSSAVSSDSSGTDSFTVSISSACTISSVVNSEHSIETNVGTYVADVGKTTITTLCNDGNGYSIYANGYSNNEEGNNKLINSEYPEYSINTGLATSGLTSAWAMKLNNIPDDPSPTPPVIEQDYNNTYGIVPALWTKVAGRAAGTTDMDEGSSFTTTYSVYASSNQHAGTYVGQVKYVLTHPAYPPAFLYMQDVNKWKNELAMEESVQATDARDGKKYWVTRLADGNIWMTQNLDLDLDPVKPLTSNDTDLTDYSLTGAYMDGYDYDANTGIITFTPERKTIDFQNTAVTGWVNSHTAPYSANKTDSTEAGHASLGNWYNWTAAIASNNSSSLTQNTLSDITKNPKNSICPKGWRMPTISDQSEIIAGSTNEFARLNYLYNNNLVDTDVGLISSPLWFTKSGYINQNGLNSLGIQGRYWTGTISGTHNAFLLFFSSSKVSYTDDRPYMSRITGHVIRCVAR